MLKEVKDAGKSSMEFDIRSSDNGRTFILCRESTVGKWGQSIEKTGFITVKDKYAKGLLEALKTGEATVNFGKRVPGQQLYVVNLVDAEAEEVKEEVEDEENINHGK